MRLEYFEIVRRHPVAEELVRRFKHNGLFRYRGDMKRIKPAADNLSAQAGFERF